MHGRLLAIRSCRGDANWTVRLAHAPDDEDEPSLVQLEALWPPRRKIPGVEFRAFGEAMEGPGFSHGRGLYCQAEHPATQIPR